MSLLAAIKAPLQNRVANALVVAGKGFVINAAKVFYALWLQVTGLVFAVFTVGGAADLVRHFRSDHLQDHGRAATVLVFTLICLWFTVLSFVRARRTRR